MAFGFSRRFRSGSVLRGLAKMFAEGCAMTPQERAGLHVSRMPIAVLALSMDEHA